MIKIEHDGTVFNVPTSWKEVTLEQFQQIEDIELAESLDKDVAFLSVLTGMTSVQVRNIPAIEFDSLKVIYDFMRNVAPSNTPKLLFTFEGIEYGFRNDVTKMSTGEYIDCDTLASSENSIQQLHLIMAIMYRPVIEKGDLNKDPTDYVIEKYNSDSLEKRGKIFKKMTLDIVLSAMVFSQALVQTSQECFQGFSVK